MNNTYSEGKDKPSQLFGSMVLSHYFKLALGEWAPSVASAYSVSDPYITCSDLLPPLSALGSHPQGAKEVVDKLLSTAGTLPSPRTAISMHIRRYISIA
jgi:hypothetical protein